MTQPIIAIRLGGEFDDKLRDAVTAALVELGTIQREVSWGIGGSPEVETLEVAIGGERVTIEDLCGADHFRRGGGGAPPRRMNPRREVRGNPLKFE